MLQLFGYVSAVLSFLSIFPYIRDIFRHKTKPHRVSWFIFFVLGVIAFFSQLAKGASHSLWLPGMITFDVFLVFLLSLRYGVGGLSKKDIIILCAAAVGLIGWYFTKEAAVALYIVILIDAAAIYLTIDKAYKHPITETFSLWVLSSVSGLFALLAVGSFNIVLLSWPLAIFLMDAGVATAILLGRKRAKLAKQ